MHDLSFKICQAVVVLGSVALGSSVARSQSLAEMVANSPVLSTNAEGFASTTPLRSLKTSQQAQVSVAAGETTIVAEGSSLNAIIRQIATVNGMKLTGTIQDEPVFGTYGPGEVSVVLYALLQGSDTNLLIRGGGSKVPQILLTPRSGPRSVASGKATAHSDATVSRLDPKSGFTGHPLAELPERTREDKPPTAMPNGMPTTMPATTNATSELPRSPNGVKTPQEIQVQLARLNETVISTRQGSADPADDRL